MPEALAPAADKRARMRAQAHLAQLFEKLARLFTCGETATLAPAEAAQLAGSLAYLLGLEEASEAEAVALLADADPEELFRRRQAELRARVDETLDVWAQVVAAMPPLRNVALRDTLASIGDIRQTYDTYFAAHEVPCSIDYQLSVPVDERLRGVDYVHAYLDELLRETLWIARFTPESCDDALRRACPDYRGLHVNLYDLLRPREHELVRADHRGRPAVER